MAQMRLQQIKNMGRGTDQPGGSPGINVGSRARSGKGAKRLALAGPSAGGKVGRQSSIHAQLALWEKEREATSAYILEASHGLGAERILAEIKLNPAPNSEEAARGKEGTGDGASSSAGVHDAMQWLDSGSLQASLRPVELSVATNWPTLASMGPITSATDASQFSAVPFDDSLESGHDASYEKLKTSVGASVGGSKAQNDVSTDAQLQ